MKSVIKSVTALEKVPRTSTRADRPTLLTQVIVLAELFGSGERDASGFCVQSDLVANRGGIKIEFKEQSGDCYMSGSVRVFDGRTLILRAERSSEDGAIDAGLVTPLSYKVRTWASDEAVTKAIVRFCEGLKPIGAPGDMLFMPAIFGPRKHSGRNASRPALQKLLRQQKNRPQSD